MYRRAPQFLFTLLAGTSEGDASEIVICFNLGPVNLLLTDQTSFATHLEKGVLPRRSKKEDS